MNATADAIFLLDRKKLDVLPGLNRESPYRFLSESDLNRNDRALCGEQACIRWGRRRAPRYTA